MWVFPKQVIKQQATEIIHPSTTPYHPLTHVLGIVLYVFKLPNTIPLEMTGGKKREKERNDGRKQQKKGDFLKF